ncbi:hypothetical protein [Sphingopyxis sp. 550A]
MTGTFKTTVMWHDSRGFECEAEVQVTYVRRPGYPQTLTDPAEPASVEITDITPLIAGTFLREGLLEDDGLIKECFEHWCDREAAAEEARADDWRERLREEF